MISKAAGPRRVLAAAVAATALALLTTGVEAAHAWRLTIDIYGSGMVEETQNPENTRQRCGSLTATTGTAALQTHCVSADIYCGLCNYTIKATPAAGFSFSRYEWVRPTDIPWSGTTSSWTWAFGNAGDFTVRAYFVDTAAPDTTLTGGPADQSFTSARTASFNLGTTQAGGAGTYICTLNNTTIPCGSTLNLSSLAEGAQTLRVQARDPSGNVDPTPAVRTWIVDTTPPVTTLAGGPVNGSRTNSRSATFGISFSEVTAGRTCRLNGNPLACDGPSIQLSSLADGSYTLTATATDRAGNAGSVVTRTWTVDTDPPTTTLTGGPANGTLSNVSTATFTIGSDEPGTAACTLDAVPLPCTLGAITLTGLTNRSHTLNVRVTDLAGNQDPGVASRTWTVDAAPPDTVIESGPSEGAESADRTAAFTFSGAGEGGRYECRLDGGAFAPCTQAAGHTLSDLPLGRHTLEVRAIDAAANVDASPASRSWTVIPVVVTGGGGGGGGVIAAVDSDGDGVLDDKDRCPSVAGGAFDLDRDGCPGPFGRISVTATASWSSVSRKGIKLRAMIVTDAPKGALVEVTCPGKKKCPFAQKRTSTGKRITLSKFAGKTLAPKTSIAIKVTLAGMIGDYVVKKVGRPGAGRKGLLKFARQPLATVRQCVPQGTTTPSRNCSMTG